jgi:hypothetical protein
VLSGLPWLLKTLERFSGRSNRIGHANIRRQWYFDVAGDRSVEQPSSLADVIRYAVRADDSNVLLAKAEIGCEPFTPEQQVAKTVAALKENPPAPFDLSVKTRVFSTKFQFVEFELRGAAWTTREIKVSSWLLNPDVPEEL